jgi:hypothetical protein
MSLCSSLCSEFTEFVVFVVSVVVGVVIGVFVRSAVPLLCSGSIFVNSMSKYGTDGVDIDTVET